MRKNIIFIVLSLVLLGVAATAKQAYPGIIAIRQPDGTCIQARVHGDEFFHYVTDIDGRVLKQGQDGFWCYGRFNMDGQLSSTGYIVGQKTPSSILSEAFYIPRAAMMLKTSELRRQHAEAMRENFLTDSPATRADSRITRRCIIIPAEFSDKKMTYTQADFQSLSADIKVYFQDQFPENYDFQFDVSPIVTLSKGYAEYGSNGRDGQQDAYNAAKAVGEACQLASESGVDFSLYDEDNDGAVDNVFLVVAGKNEAEAGEDNLIWPHSWDVTYANVHVTLNGKEIRSYAVSSELSYRQSSRKYEFTTIGTFCHEYSHVLGLMDLYDTDYEENGLANSAWATTALMNAGNYNNDGRTPPAYNAIDRDMLGIGNREMLEPGTYELEPIRLNGRYLRYNTPTPGEYYLIECRDNGGWDEYIEGSGLAIYHIDKSQNMSGYSSYLGRNVRASERWWTNEVNCYTGHLCADIIEPKSRPVNASHVFYPYGTNNSFSYASSPSFVFWDGTLSPIVIADITRNGDNIIFRVGETGGNKPSDPVDITSDVYQEAAIIRWCSSDPLANYDAVFSWGLSGKDKETLTVSPYEPGHYAVVIEGLKEAAAYSGTIYYEINGIKGKEASVSFTTRPIYEGGRPFIYLKDISGRNEDGTFTKEAKLPLRLYNCPDTESVVWYYDGKEIKAGGNGYFTPSASGTLKADITYSDGGKDIIVKEVKIR